MNESRGADVRAQARERTSAACATLGIARVDLEDGSIEGVSRRMLAYWLAGSTIDGRKPSTIELGRDMGVAPSAIRAALARMEPWPGPRTVAVTALVTTYRQVLADRNPSPLADRAVVNAYRRLRRLKSWGRPRKDGAQ